MGRGRAAGDGKRTAEGGKRTAGGGKRTVGGGKEGRRIRKKILAKGKIMLILEENESFTFPRNFNHLCGRFAPQKLGPS